MIKTIDTRNITDIMLEAQNVIDGTTTYSDPLSFKDAADIFIAMAEAAPAVEPAHKYTSVYAGNVVGIYKDGEQMTIDQIVADLNAKAVEPAMLNTCLSNAKQEQSGWLRAIDEALVCHHVGVANVSDTYEQAKDKLNKMLCVVQDIGSYFAKQEPAQAVPVDDEAAFRNYACRCKTLWAGLDWDNQVVEIAREAYLAGRKNSAPPAIDAETKRMVLEQTNTKAAEPAQSVPAFWASENILKESLRDNISCILTTTKCAANTVPLYTAPPAIVEAVPVAWLPIETAPKDGTEILVTYGKQGFVMQLVRFDRTFNYWKNKGEAELGLENNATNWMPIPDPRKPLYTVPPAIDETRHKLILVCEYLETVGLMFVSPRVISSQIRAILEAGNGE